VVDVVPCREGTAVGSPASTWSPVGSSEGTWWRRSRISGGARPATLRRAAIRLLAVVPYALLSGLGGAVIVGPVLGALTGHLVSLWWLGALLVFSAAAVTMAFQTLSG